MHRFAYGEDPVPLPADAGCVIVEPVQARGGARVPPDEFLDTRIIEADGLDVATRDFLAGMTDRFAVALYERLFIPKPWIGPMAWNQL